MKNNYLVSQPENGLRLDLFLVGKDPSHPRAYFQRLIEKGAVTVNNKSLKSRYHIKEGENIEVEHPKLVSPSTLSNHVLDIIYEDEAILVLNKPAGLIVHPPNEEGRESLVQALLGHNASIAEAVYDSTVAISRLRPGIVHRLDKDTSGLLVVAKSKLALTNLASQFKDHLVEKEYTALVWGNLTEAQTIHTKMGRKLSRRNLMGIRPLDEEGREAITHLQPIQTYTVSNDHQPVSLISCRIETGRTHQIRVHCKYKGHPVLGDVLYSTKPATALSQQLQIKRQLLHASSLRFLHPTSNKKVEFQAALPLDFEQALKQLTLVFDFQKPS